MLLNEPSHHTTRTAAAGAAAVPGTGTGELPAVEIDHGPARSRASAEADTVAFVAVDAVDVDGGAGSDGRGESGGDGDAGSAGGASGSDAISTVALDVAAVKRAAAEAPTVAFSPVDPAGVAAEDEISTAELVSAPQHPDAEAVEVAPEIAAAEIAAAEIAAAEAAAAETAAAETAVAETEDSTAYLVSSDLTTPTSTVVAVPETADDVIATIHAAATAVARADRRARRAAVVKEDPWTGLDLHQPGTPAPAGNVLDLLAPVLERPILVVEQPGPPAAADVVALHRSELAAEFVDPPVVAAGAEPPIPPRYGPGLSVLPHIEFPV